MNRLRRFTEKTMPDGRITDRVAYVIDVAALPTSLAAAEWVEDSRFNAAEAVLADPSLKSLYKTAIEKGCAIMTTPAA